MEKLFNVLLALHISGGGLGLIAGTINITRKKGDKKHKLIGKLFFYGMLLAGTTALILSILHPNYFLFIVGVFTLYMVGTGDRYLSLKSLSKDQNVKPIDWLLTSLMLLFGVTFIIFGIRLIVIAEQFGIVFIVFGFISLSFVRKDFANYRGKSNEKNFWLLGHLQRMTGAYIASLTAFLVVNNKFLPNLVAWLLPTIIVVPLIFVWSNKYKRKKM